MLRRLHAWIGVAAGLYIFVQALSGFLLMSKAPLLVNEHPALRRDARDATPLPQVLERITTTVGPDWSYISLPKGAQRWIEVRMTDERHLLFNRHGEGPAPTGFLGRPSFVHWLHDMHTELSLGQAGENIAGAMGVCFLFLSISGVIVWWPYRRKITLRNMAPSGVSRASLIKWHWSMGIVFAALGTLLSATGVLMSFNSVPHKLIMSVGGETLGTPVINAVRASTADGPRASWDTIITNAEAVFPDDRLGLVANMRPPHNAITFRTHREGEWNPTGRSLIAVDPYAGHVLARWNAFDATPTGRIMMMVFPLHAAQTGNSYYTLLMLAASLFVAFIAISGVLAYVRRARPTA
jgi:uncharacterized iron-regulated membrane protein